MIPSSKAQKYIAHYSQGVIIRDHSLEMYDQFLHNMGEKKSLVELVEHVLERKRICRILDVGCGNANAVRTLKKKYGSSVHTMGIDLLPPDSREGLDEFLEGDVHAIPVPMECDLLLSFRSLHQMGEMETLIPRFGKSLARGGRGYIWIRMRTFENEKPVFVGEMNEKEESYLRSLETQKTLDGISVLIEPIESPIPLTNENETPQRIIEGYILLLYRSP